MPQISYRANLSAAIFPLSLSAAGRTVIVPGPDNNYDRRVDPEGEQKDAGIPQAIYLENVVPTANGYQTLRQDNNVSLVPPSGPSGVYILNQIPVRDTTSSANVFNVTLAFDGATTLLFSQTGVGGWANVVFSGAATYPTLFSEITFAVVRGECYVLIKGTLNTYLYTATITAGVVILTNVSGSVTYITLSDIYGICGSNNYLLTFEADGTVHWSSTTDPLDFTPSLVSGAGEITPNGLYGGFQNSYSTGSGFYIFSRIGIVVANYTGNSRYPWKFVPVQDTNQTVAASTQDPNSYSVFIYDVAHNFYVLQGNTVAAIAPELSSYIRSNRCDYTYDFTNNSLVEFQPRNDPIKLYCFYNRYICVSTGAFISSSGQVKYKILVIFDLMLRRYGRIVRDHNYAVASKDLNSREQSLALIDAVTGEATNYLFAVHGGAGTATDGVIILGKFKYVRGRRLELQEVNCEGQFQEFACKIFPSTDGTILGTAVTPTTVTSDSKGATYNCRVEGENISVGFVGSFNIDFMQLAITLGAAR